MDNASTSPSPLKTFGGFAGDIGIKMSDWRLDHCEMYIDLAENHRNGLGVVHGGVISSLIDVCCTHAGIFCTVPGNIRSGLTASLTVNLMGSAREGRITAIARKRGGGRTLFMASAEVFDDSGALIAVGEAVCRYRRGSENPEGMPRN
jgi:uncharacterized protein (TIGR00369 family)